MIGCQGRGQHIDPDKCEVSWSPLTNHQMARNLLQTHSIAPTHTKFTEVKSSFFILQSNGGPCLFHCIWCSWRPAWVAQVISWFYTIREGDNFWFSLTERKFWNIVQWCRKSFERLWEHFASIASESRSWRRGLHVASIQNGELSHSACKYNLFHFYYYCLNSRETCIKSAAAVVIYFFNFHHSAE